MTQEEKLLIKIQTLFYFAGSIAGIFLNLFLFQLGNFRAVVTFDVIALTLLVTMYVASGKLLKRFSSRTLIRLGFGFFILENLMLFLLRERAIDFLVPLAIIAGLGHGCFWPGNNLSVYILTHTETRNSYLGKLNFWINIALGLGPILGGSIIYVANIYSLKVNGYASLFLLVALIDIYLVILASNLPRFSGVDFSYRHLLRHKRSWNWKTILKENFLYGLWDVGFNAISGVLIYLIVTSEFTVGTIKTITALVFAVGSMWAGHVLQKNKFAFVYATIISSIGLLIFGLQQNWLGIVSLVLITNIFQPYLNISVSKMFYDTIDKVKEPWQSKYHFLIERDFALGVGRVMNYLILLQFFKPENQIAIAKTWVLVIPILPLIIGFLQWKLVSGKNTS